MKLENALALVQGRSPMGGKSIVEFFQKEIDSVEFDDGVKLDRTGPSPTSQGKPKGCYVQYQNSAYRLDRSVHYEVIKANAINQEQRKGGLYIRLDDERNREDEMRKELKEVAKRKRVFDRSTQFFADSNPMDCGQEPQKVITKIWKELRFLYDTFDSTLEQFGAKTGGTETNHQSTESTMSDNTNHTSYSHLYSPNLIYFGAPGTGKSHELNKKVVEDFGDRYERVTFYPTYSYAQFVGCYKPTMEAAKGAKTGDILSPKQLTEKLKTELDSIGKPAKEEADSSVGKMATILLFADNYYDSLEKLDKNVRATILKDAGAKTDFDRAYLNDEITATRIQRGLKLQGAEAEAIAYKFVPGPFLRVLVDALNHPAEKFCLVIEEINRANAAAVFGDVFQLLDRDEEGQSEYDIAATEDMRRHLDKALSDTGKETLKKLAGEGNLKIPANMYIWATMNSADQGVFPMDTAFKRRWAFKYIGIDAGISGDCKKWTIEGSGFLWNAVRTFLNDRLTDNGVNEDKLMGPWFVKPENGSAVSLVQFQSKVLMYLWEDAARMCRRKFFADKIKTYPDLVKCWPDAFKGIENWEEVKAGWIPPGPGAAMDGAGAPERTAEPQTAATATGTETQPSE